MGLILTIIMALIWATTSSTTIQLRVDKLTQDPCATKPTGAKGCLEAISGVCLGSTTTGPRNSCFDLDQTECGTSDFCTWTAVPDVGQVARANYYLERGIISEELFEQRLDEINKSEVCVPHRVAECAASSLMQGPHCSDTCAFLAVPTEDLLQGCQISQDPCCKYGVSEKACLSGIVTGGVCSWNSEIRECSFAKTACANSTSTTEQLYVNCQTTSMCSDLTAIAHSEPTSVCVDNGWEKPGLDMCSGASDIAKGCLLCKESVEKIQQELKPELQMEANCNITNDKSSLTCSDGLRELARIDWICKNHHVELLAGFAALKNTTAANATEACTIRGLCKMETTCNVCEQALNTAMQMPEFTLNTTTAADLLDLCYFTQMNANTMHVKKQHDATCKMLEGDKCTMTEGCIMDGYCSFPQPNNTIDSCMWATSKDGCNLRENCVFMPGKNHGKQGISSCDVLGTAVLTYGVKYLSNTTNIGFVLGECSSTCGSGCEACDISREKMAQIATLLTGTDQEASDAFVKQCNSMNQKADNSRSTGTCLSRQHAQCELAQSEKTCGDFAQCTFKTSCTRETPGDLVIPPSLFLPPPLGTIIPTRDTFIQLTEQNNNKNQMKVTFTFPGEFNALENSAKLVQGIIYNLAEYAKVDHEDVEITDIREGSIILEVIIRIPSDMSRENMGNFAIALTEQPQEVFTDDFIEEFGIPIVQVKISRDLKRMSKLEYVPIVIGSLLGLTALYAVSLGAYLFKNYTRRRPNWPLGDYLPDTSPATPITFSATPSWETTGYCADSDSDWQEEDRPEEP